MATSQEIKTNQEHPFLKPPVNETGYEGVPERLHEVGEEVRVAHHYEEIKARAEELGGNPELVTALHGTAEVVKGVVADIDRQRALAEETPPFPRRGTKTPHHPSHN